MAGPVVLVVDPVSQTAERVAQALVGTRYVVRAAKDATEADRELQTEGVIALIAAITLPRGTGYEVARAARARHPEAAIFLVTGGFDVYNADRAAEHGVHGRLSRPLSVEVVRRQLEAVLGPLSAEDDPVDASAALEALPEVEPEPLPVPAAAQPAAPPRASAPVEPTPAVGDERIASFLPRDWRTHPPVTVDPAVVAPAVERAILAVLPEVVEAVLNKAILSSAPFREMVEVAVEEALREELPAITRRVIRERMAEIERAGKPEK